MFRWTNIYMLRAGASVLMILALLWLTVSLPFVAKAKQGIAMMKSNARADDSNPLTNSTEEKTPTTINEEYLHQEGTAAPAFILIISDHAPHLATDLAHFHSELITPPPEA